MNWSLFYAVILIVFVVLFVAQVSLLGLWPEVFEIARMARFMFCRRSTPTVKNWRQKPYDDG